MYFCGFDWNCWGSWLGSPGVAAWIQAVVAVMAILFANRRAVRAYEEARNSDQRQDDAARQREREREHIDQGKNLARAKVAIINIASIVETVLRLRARNNNDFVVDQLESAISEIREEKTLLRALLLEDLPNPEIMAYINSAASLAGDFASYFEVAYQKEILNEGFVQRLREFVDDMNQYHDSLQGFHDRFVTDPDAKFIPVRKTAQNEGDSQVQK